MAMTVSPVGGTKTVATSGTAEKLVATSTIVVSVRIQALKTNTNPIFVGDLNVDKTTSPQIAMDADEWVSFEPPGGFDLDLTEFYVDVTTNGEGVNFLYLV